MIQNGFLRRKNKNKKRKKKKDKNKKDSNQPTHYHPSQSERGSSGNEGLLHILQSRSTTVASPSKNLESYRIDSYMVVSQWQLCRPCIL